MKLIDVDKLNFEGQHYNKSQMKAILDFIDNQPTGFDVDKVVEQLGNYKMWKELLIYDLNFRERQIIKKAIDVVKVGGIDEEIKS